MTEKAGVKQRVGLERQRIILPGQAVQQDSLLNCLARLIIATYQSFRLMSRICQRADFPSRLRLEGIRASVVSKA